MPGGYSRPLLPGNIVSRLAFCGQRIREEPRLFPKTGVRRHRPDDHFSTGEGAITQAQSYPKRGITPCPSSGRLYVRRIPADPVTFFLWTSGNHAEAWFCFYDFIANVLICSCLCGMAGCNFSSILLHITLHVCCNILICRKIIVASNVTEPFRLLSDGRIISLCKNILNY